MPYESEHLVVGNFESVGQSGEKSLLPRRQAPEDQLTQNKTVAEHAVIFVEKISEASDARGAPEIKTPNRRVDQDRLHRRRRTALRRGPSPYSAFRRLRASRSSRTCNPISMTAVFDLAPVSASARWRRSASRSRVVLMHTIMHESRCPVLPWGDVQGAVPGDPSGLPVQGSLPRSRPQDSPKRRRRYGPLMIRFSRSQSPNRADPGPLGLPPASLPFRYPTRSSSPQRLSRQIWAFPAASSTPPPSRNTSGRSGAPGSPSRSIASTLRSTRLLIRSSRPCSWRPWCGILGDPARGDLVGLAPRATRF